jgi:hypothetical protein
MRVAGNGLMTIRWRVIPGVAGGPRTWRLTVRGRALLLVLFGGCAPAITPLPPAAPPPVPVVRPPAPIASAAVRVTLALHHDPVRYTVRSRTQVTVDSVGTPLVEEVNTSAFVTFTLTRVGDPTSPVPLGVRGTGRVERYVLTSTGRLATARPLPVTGAPPGTPGSDSPSLPLTVPFEALVDGTTARVSVTPPLPNECDHPDTGATALARELLVRLPGALATGSAWTDTARVFVCRGGVPTTVETIAANRVTAFDPSPEGPATRVHVVRTLSIRVSGEQRSAWRRITLSGRGTGEQHVVVSVPAGVVQELRSDTRTALDIYDSARPRDGQQRVTQRVDYRARVESLP